MQKYLLFAGYSKRTFVREARKIAQKFDLSLICAYTRQPLTEPKIEYLKLFDTTYDLTDPTERENFMALESISAITCTQERDMAAYIEILRLKNYSSNEQTEKYSDLIDKLRFKLRTREAHPELVPSGADITEEDTDLDTLPFPAVVKPTGLAGSSYVSVVRTKEEAQHFLNAHKEQMLSNGTDFYKRTISVIAEEFIIGPQYSVNVYIDKNQGVTYCPIMRVIPAYEIGSNDTYNALQYITDELTDTEMESLEDAVQKIVTLFDLPATSAHFDAVLSPSGWKFFEVGMRIGGKRNKIYDLSHGFSHIENDILNRLGKSVIIGERKKIVAILQTASEKYGILNKISYTRRITKPGEPMVHEAKLAKLGAEVLPVSEGGGTITRHYIIGDEEAEVLRVAHELHEDIELDVS